ncbi:hypothetical protein FAI41_05790 [Acetobacteraceae bacterium]|nr:hypothetical protein FAI41_05790 [Acetobacteraceae bacterium]
MQVLKLLPLFFYMHFRRLCSALSYKKFIFIFIKSRNYFLYFIFVLSSLILALLFHFLLKSICFVTCSLEFLMTLLNNSDAHADMLKAEIASMIKVNPNWFIGSGAVLCLLGLLALSSPVGLTLASTVFLGIFLILAGVAQLTVGFVHTAAYHLKPHHPRWESILTGACLLIGGLLMCVQPVDGAIFVTACLGALFIFSGIGQVFVAIHTRHAPGHLWVLVGGIVTTLLGVVLFLNLNGASLQFLGLLIALELLMLGFVALSYGLSLKSLRKQHAEDDTYLL